ncbi:hypothetical protein B0H34DRAFT_737622 [Crassisporium funariophilum]|nr:hypothetical protein B0H34DRAFT_737622 [Crassisporium funariophilum]
MSPSVLPSTTDDVLFDHLSPGNLLRYGRACKETNQAVKSYMRRNFQLSRLLGRFFTPIEMSYFRYWQSRAGVLISGSIALQFFDRTFYPGSDLDLYVEHRYSEPIAWWLVSIGYTYKPRKEQGNRTLKEALLRTSIVSPQLDDFFTLESDYDQGGVANVYDFYKHNANCKIQLITTHHSSLEVILGFHSTCVMNLISHSKAYCLYPKGTFEERRSLEHRPTSGFSARQSAARQASLHKYHERGWKIVEYIKPEEIRDPRSAFAEGSRYVGDRQCWTYPILPELALPEGHVESNGWALCFDQGDADMTYMILRKRQGLRYSYLVDIPMQHYISPVFCLADFERYLDDDIRLLLKFQRESQE